LLIQVFKLFDVKWKYDPNLSIEKVKGYYNGNPKYDNALSYIESLHLAHQELLYDHIFAGYTIQKLEINPISSFDAMHGQPRLWTDILNEITEEKDRQHNEQMQDSYIDSSMNKILPDYSFVSENQDKSAIIEG
jgi:hypothetical protein